MKSGDEQLADQPSERHRLPLPQNPRAIICVSLAGFGSLCWEITALCGLPNGNSLLNGIWLAAVLVGAGAMLLGFIGGLVYRRFQVAAVAVVVSLLSPPLWLWLFLKLHPLFGPDASPGFLLGFGFSLQLPLVLVVLWRSAWQGGVKTMLTAFALTGLLGVIILDHAHVQQEAASAPHLSGQYLSSLFAKKNTSALSRLRGQRIVVTGIISGQDAGLFGGGPPRIGSGLWGGFIEIDDLEPFDTLEDGQTASILGTLQGQDAQGMFHMNNCRSVMSNCRSINLAR